MLSRSWIRRFFQPHAASGSSQTPPRARLTLDALESRDVPSTIVVDNFTDTVVPGHTNLRQAVAQANAAVGDDAIVFNTRPFSPPQTIHLTGGELELSDTTGKTSIIGPQRGLTVNAGGLSRVFNVDPVVSASLSRLTITGGANSDDTGGAGVCNAGTLTLTDCTIRDNAATGGDGFSEGAFGGGISNSGTLTLIDCTIRGNTATGGFAGGAGIVNDGTLTLTDCVVRDNFATSISDEFLAGASGGGILISGGTLTIIGSTITRNSSTADGLFGTSDGGGVSKLLGEVTIRNSTITFITAETGGGLFSSIHPPLPG